MTEELQKQIAELAQLLVKNNQKVATAESCTGGLISAAMTEVSGASDWFDRGFVTYSNEAKNELLDVRMGTIEKYNAVSGEVAAQMVLGALKHSKANFAVSVTGFAGPSGSAPGKPVGTVFIGWGRRDEMPMVARFHFEGSREQVRQQAAEKAVGSLVGMLKELYE